MHFFESADIVHRYDVLPGVYPISVKLIFVRWQQTFLVIESDRLCGYAVIIGYFFYIIVFYLIFHSGHRLIC